jgi:hypothetical protein
VASVVLGTGLDLVLIPWFQRTTGNGGIGAVAAFVISEVVVFAGAALRLPRHCLSRAVAVDVVRALGAAGVTALLFHSLPPLPILAGIPACLVVFSLCALALGLVRRSDIALFQAMVQRRVAPATMVESGSGSPAA